MIIFSKIYSLGKSLGPHKLYQTSGSAITYGPSFLPNNFGEQAFIIPKFGIGKFKLWQHYIF